MSHAFLDTTNLYLFIIMHYIDVANCTIQTMDIQKLIKIHLHTQKSTTTSILHTLG